MTGQFLSTESGDRERQETKEGEYSYVCHIIPSDMLDGQEDITALEITRYGISPEIYQAILEKWIKEGADWKEFPARPNECAYKHWHKIPFEEVKPLSL